MNIQANTIEEYFVAAGEREPDLRQLDALIRKSAPELEPVLFGGMTGKMLGYGLQPYQSKSMKKPGQWPLVALALQKNYISLYICVVVDGQYVAEKNAERLGAVKTGKSCINIKKIEDINTDVVREIISDASKRIAAGEKLFGI